MSVKGRLCISLFSPPFLSSRIPDGKRRRTHSLVVGERSLFFFLSVTSHELGIVNNEMQNIRVNISTRPRTIRIEDTVTSQSYIQDPLIGESSRS